MQVVERGWVSPHSHMGGGLLTPTTSLRKGGNGDNAMGICPSPLVMVGLKSHSHESTLHPISKPPSDGGAQVPSMNPPFTLHPAHGDVGGEGVGPSMPLAHKGGGPFTLTMSPRKGERMGIGLQPP
ncbi:hypothetical protein FH972_012519 [Carpinus fangiana]|uniref:Uncharacterized protein n=1 Tax=Carpinus fangiana TaxID=176857 RepID=A0A5N6R5J3_9ROSI|nr:hypothetical protein FH972_012519 [Carpinus fangiana]